MKLQAGIFWGGQDAVKSYQSASSILEKLDEKLFVPVLFFVDQQYQIYAVDTKSFTIGSWTLDQIINPQDLGQLINLAFVECWVKEAAALLDQLSALGIPYVGQQAALRESDHSRPVPSDGEIRFSCLVLDDFETVPFALYPRFEGADTPLLTPLQLEQIRAKSLQLYRQFDLGPFARIQGRYTSEDQLFFDPPQLSYPLTEKGYLEQDLAPFQWSAAHCCTYSVLVSLQRRFRENPKQKAYQAIFNHIITVSQEQILDTYSPITVLIGASGSDRSAAFLAAHFFIRIVPQITDKKIVVYECLSATSHSELLPVPLGVFEGGVGINIPKRDTLYGQIKEKTESLQAQFRPSPNGKPPTQLMLSELNTDFVYLCLGDEFKGGHIEKILDKMGVAHSGSSLSGRSFLDRRTNVTLTLEQGMVHLKSSVWCTKKKDCFTLGHSLIQKGGQVITPARRQLLALNEAGVLQNIQHSLQKILEPCELGAYAEVESYLRIFEDNSVHLSVVELDTTPLLTPDHVLFAHAEEAGMDEKTIFGHLLNPDLTTDLALPNFRLVPTMVNENELEPNQGSAEPGREYTAPQVDADQPGQEQGYFARLWQRIRNFITAPIFLRSLGGIIVGSLLFFVLINLFLSMYTRHGSAEIVVENYLDKTFEEARRQARGKGLKAVITDSTFVIGMPPNLVIEQDPKPGSKVKKRRTIYLWVTGGQAPDVLLPNLAGKDDFDTYQRELDRRGIELSIKERQYDRKLEENTILGFYYEGKPVSVEQIQNGFKIPKGSKMEAIVSKRSDGMVAMPDMVCQTFEAAKFELESNQLELGEVYGTRNDQAYVWKQEPAYASGSRIPIGSSVNLHLTTELPAACQ